MDLIYKEKIHFRVPIVGFSNVLGLTTIVFVSAENRKFHFHKTRIGGNDTFLFYEKDLVGMEFMNKLSTIDNLQYDISLNFSKRFAHKCVRLSIPNLESEVFDYLLDTFSKVFPLKEVHILFESYDVYHECDLNIEDFYLLGYGQLTKTGVWTNGFLAEECFIGFIICAAIPMMIEDPIYDFIEFDYTDQFYLRISLSQIINNFPLLETQINKQIRQIIEEIPCADKFKKEDWYDLWLITKNVEIYDSDLPNLSTIEWSPLWLMKTLSPLLNHFNSYKFNPKIIASCKRTLSDVKLLHEKV